MIEITNTTDSVDESAVRQKYEDITRLLISSGKTITTMESCTSGQIASLITDTEGSSAIMKGALVTYSNEAKVMHGVNKITIDTYGVYSSETASEMANVCRNMYHADFGIGVTGSFGNVDPNNSDSVPGEVFFAIATEKGAESYHCSVPVQSSRLMYKLYMADVIAEQILYLLA